MSSRKAVQVTVNITVMIDLHPSDFRDVGPVLAALLAPQGEPLHADVLDLELVSYADVFDVPEPTWVGAALCAIHPATTSGT